jgi:hypothetical protein
MTDWSFIMDMEIPALIAFGIVATGIAGIICFFKFGYKDHLKHHEKIAEIRASASSGILSEEISAHLRDLNDKVEILNNRYSTDAMQREERQIFVDAKLDGLKAENKEMMDILSAVSCDTQYSIFINKDADIYERLRAFRVLTAFAKNGDIREAGYALILHNKPAWREIEKHKLKVPILNQKHWDETMDYIKTHIFGGI